MNHSLIGYSPYRNDMRSAKLQEISNKAASSKTTEVIKFQLTPGVIMVTMFLMILALGSLYVMNFNKVATKGYILKRLELSRQELQEQNDLKTLGLADAKSMRQMIESGAIDNMRKPGNVSYVFGDSVIAKAL